MRRNLKFVLLERVVLMAGRLLTIFLITRNLGPEGQGQYALLMTVWQLASVLGIWGLNIANNYYAARVQSSTELGEILGNTIVFLALSAAVVGICLIFIQQKTLLLDILPTRLAPLLPLGAVSTMFSVCLYNILLGADSYKAHAVGSMTQQILFILSLILMEFSDTFDISVVGWAWIISLNVATCLWFVVLLRKSDYRVTVNFEILWKQIRYGLGAHTFTTLNMLSLRLDALIIANLLGATALGWYSLATSATEMLLNWPKMFTNIVLTESSKNGRVPIRIFQFLSGTQLAVGLLVGVSAPIFIPFIFGVEFSNSVLPLQILLIGTFMMGMGLAGTFYLFGLSDNRTPAISTIFGGVAIVLLDLILIPGWGIVGAALASSIAYSITAIVIYIVVSRRENMDMYRYFLPPSASVLKQVLANYLPGSR